MIFTILIFYISLVFGCNKNSPKNPDPSLNLGNTELTELNKNDLNENQNNNDDLNENQNNNDDSNEDENNNGDSNENQNSFLNYKNYLKGENKIIQENIDNKALRKEDSELKNKWKDKMKNNPESFYKDILSIYNYEYLGPNTKYVTNFFEKAIKSGSSENEALGSQIISSNNNSNNDLITSITRRYPVFYGGAVTSSYSSEKLKNVLGYDDKHQEFMNKVNPNTRFALLGKAYINKVKQPNNPEYGYFIHIWGINLEKKVTHDYKKYTDTNGKIKRPEYAIAVGRMIENIMNAALQASNNESGKKIYLRTGGVGLGFFLSQADKPDANFARRLFIEILAYFSDLPQFSKITIDYCLRKKSISLEMPPYASKKIKLKTNNNFNMIEDGNMYDLKKYSKGEIPVITNAWDNRSPVGNGGAADPSQDGYTVSGKSRGSAMPNTSYLHNYWFSKERPITKYTSNINDKFFIDIAKRVSN